MFTGIIEAVGSIERLEAVPGGKRVRIAAPGYGQDLAPGDSIAVDGVCLTVVSRGEGWFESEISPETSSRSTFGAARRGRRVNLERPLLATARLGGHFVQGHVDGVGSVRSLRSQGAFVDMTIAHPREMSRFLVEKGSVGVNGVSLTIAGISRGTFKVALIPHTLKATNLSEARPGTRVNLEVDVLAKYVEALVGR